VGGEVSRVKFVASAFVSIALSAGTASAVDMALKAPAGPAADPWDVAFGSALMSDYVFRGITQSAHKPSVAAYFEPRYNVNKSLQFYGGISGESIDFPNHAAAEIDFYGGMRPTFDKLALDLGFWYYYYPGGINFGGHPAPASVPLGGLVPNIACANGVYAMPVAAFGADCQIIKGDESFWELYFKPTYTVNNNLALGAVFFYSPSWLNSGASGTYASGTAKLTAPSTWTPKDIGMYLLGEFGHYRFGTTDAFYATPNFLAGIKYPDYNTWNVGIGFTHKVFTLDLRYSQTDLSKSNCAVLTSDHTAALGGVGAASATNPGGFTSNWCGAAFIAKFSADLTAVTNFK
jgi:hypothetical protein